MGGEGGEGTEEIKGTGCDNSDEMDQFSALTQRRKTFPKAWCVQTSYLASSRVQKQALLPATSSPHTAGMLNKTIPLLTVPSEISSLSWCPVYLLPSCVGNEQLRTWHGLGVQEFLRGWFFFFGVRGRGKAGQGSAVPPENVAMMRYSVKLCSLGFTLKWVQMLHIVTNAQVLPH